MSLGPYTDMWKRETVIGLKAANGNVGVSKFKYGHDKGM